LALSVVDTIKAVVYRANEMGWRETAAGRWFPDSNDGGNEPIIDVMQVCKSGHFITDTYLEHPHFRKDRCPECGKETIIACPECGEKIPGARTYPSRSLASHSTVPPKHCSKCGKPFPWTSTDKAIPDGNKDRKPDDDHEEIVFDDFQIDGGNAKGEGGFVRLRRKKQMPTTNKVFVVHGHDEAMKLKVAGVLTALGLEPIILHEQPNKGQTIVEKFEANAAVDFAVVLLSPDDMGFAKDDNRRKAKPRARQNVLIELGYFAGKLGRGKVCALRKSDVEIPSDLSGVVYTVFDEHGNWRIELVRELKAAGYEIDANALVDRTRSQVRRHLAANDLSEKPETTKPIENPVSAAPVAKMVGEDARALLIAGADQGGGNIQRTRTEGIFGVWAAGREWGSLNDTRESARWLSALDQLVAAKLVQPNDDSMTHFHVTDAGYKLRDSFRFAKAAIMGVDPERIKGVIRTLGLSLETHSFQTRRPDALTGFEDICSELADVPSLRPYVLELVDEARAYFHDKAFRSRGERNDRLARIQELLGKIRTEANVRD